MEGAKDLSRAMHSPLDDQGRQISAVKHRLKCFPSHKTHGKEWGWALVGEANMGNWYIETFEGFQNANLTKHVVATNGRSSWSCHFNDYARRCSVGTL